MAPLLQVHDLEQRFDASGGFFDRLRLRNGRITAPRRIVHAVNGVSLSIERGEVLGIAGLVLAGRVNAVYPLAGLDYETDAIAAVIIGGASFFGGVGSIANTIIGVLLIAVLRNGLNLRQQRLDYPACLLDDRGRLSVDPRLELAQAFTTRLTLDLILSAQPIKVLLGLPEQRLR